MQLRKPTMAHLLHIVQQAVATACAPEDNIHAKGPDLSNASAVW